MLVSVKICVALMFCTGLTSVWATAPCESGKLVCKNCREVAKCPEAAAAPDAPADGTGERSERADGEEGELTVEKECPSNQACLEVLGTAVCVAVASSNCNNCNGQPTACDPYDNTIVHACVTGRAPVEIETCVNATCRAGECSATSAPTDPAEACAGVTGSEYVIVKPACDTGILCIDNQATTTFECPEDQYFDPKAYKCKSLPVDPCGSQGTGFFSNPTDCSIGIICVDGTVVAETPCGPSEVYDPENRACGDEADVTCPLLDGCTFESDDPSPSPSVAPGPSPSPSVAPGPSPSPSVAPGPSPSPSVAPGPSPSPSAGPGPTSPPPPIPTLRPPTCSASNVNQRYPHETDCKKYWACRELSTNSYTYVQNSCIGTLLFNPVTRYCDKAANVPNC